MQTFQTGFLHIFSISIFIMDQHYKITYLYNRYKIIPGHPKQLSGSKCILVYRALQIQQN